MMIIYCFHLSTMSSNTKYLLAIISKVLSVGNTHGS